MLRAYARFVTGPSHRLLADAGLLVLRLWLGLSMLLLHGLMKIGNYETLRQGFPDPLGLGTATSLHLAIFAEAVCSLLLVLGLLTRLALLQLIATMAVAWILIHGGALSGDHSGELAFIYLAGFVALFLAGPGRFSIDHLILRRLASA